MFTSRELRKNLPKFPKPMKFYLIQRNEKSMICKDKTISRREVMVDQELLIWVDFSFKVPIHLNYLNNFLEDLVKGEGE